MEKIVKISESELVKIIKNLINEDEFYSKISIDEKIRSSISLEDKKTLYKYITIKDMDSLKNKMHEISDKIIKEMGKDYKSHIHDYLKRMVGKMILTYNKGK